MASYPSLNNYLAGQRPASTHGVEQPLPMRYSWGPRYNPASNQMDAPDQKGVGFYGPQTLGQGTRIAGEYGRTDMLNGQLRNYPSFFQGMSPPQLATAMTAARMQQPVPAQLDDAAYNAAKGRVNAGRSPFFEQGRDPYPQWSPDQYWEAPFGMR